MKIYETLTTVRLNAHVQIFTSAEYKEEFVQHVFINAMENIIYSLKPNRAVMERTIELFALHFENQRGSDLLDKSLLQTTYLRCLDLITTMIDAKLPKPRRDKLRHHETPTRLLKHFKLEVDAGGACTVYWSRSLQIFLSK